MKKVKTEDLRKALLGIEADRQLSPEIVEGALVEAMSKAYRKHVDIPEAHVRVELDEHIHIYPEKEVVEEIVYYENKLYHRIRTTLWSYRNGWKSSVSIKYKKLPMGKKLMKIIKNTFDVSD